MDIKSIVGEDGNFTLGITKGDLIAEDGFDTAINMSLFTDARANEDQIAQSERRRGWLGNTVSKVPGRQLGSFLWLVDQSRLIPNTLNKTINFAQLALDWMVEDQLAKSVTVDGVIVPKLGIELIIIITHTDDTVTTHYRKLWELTGSGN